MRISPVQIYDPPPESLGGWRSLEGDEDVRSAGGMDPEQLDRVLEGQVHLWGGDSWGGVGRPARSAEGVGHGWVLLGWRDATNPGGGTPTMPGRSPPWPQRSGSVDPPTALKNCVNQSFSSAFETPGNNPTSR